MQIIERAKVEDVDRISALWMCLMNDHEQFDSDFFAKKTLMENVEENKESLIDYISDPEKVIFVFKIDKVIEGFVTAQIDKLGCFEIYNDIKFCIIDDVLITSKFRGKGYGGLFFNEIEKWAKEHKASRIDLNVFARNYHAIGFFEGIGFTELFKRFSKDI